MAEPHCIGDPGQLEVELAISGKNLVVRVHGVLDVQTAGDFRRRIVEALSESGARNLYLNLSGLTFVDSSGLGVILGRFRQVTESGGTMGLVAVPEQLMRTVAMGGLPKLMPLMATEQQIQAG